MSYTKKSLNNKPYALNHRFIDVCFIHIHACLWKHNQIQATEFTHVYLCVCVCAVLVHSSGHRKLWVCLSSVTGCCIGEHSLSCLCFALKIRCPWIPLQEATSFLTALHPAFPLTSSNRQQLPGSESGSSEAFVSLPPVFCMTFRAGDASTQMA